MFTLLRGGDVFDPEARGRLDVLLCHETIVAMAPAIDVSSLPAPATVVDVGSHHVVPGFVAPGKDADIVVMDAGLEVRHVFARGRRLLADGQHVAKSLFEDKVFQDPAPRREGGMT